MANTTLLDKEINLFDEGQDFSNALVKRIIEALLFASASPLSFQKIRDVIETKRPIAPQKLRFLLETIQEECISQQRAYRLEETDDGFVFKTCEELTPYIAELFRNKRGEKLSQAALEVLAIIAYRQPITKPEIESIRGVDCSGTLQSLAERELVETKGRLEAPGRPTLYGVTQNFLRYFGLKDLKDLPH